MNFNTKRDVRVVTFFHCIYANFYHFYSSHIVLFQRLDFIIKRSIYLKKKKEKRKVELFSSQPRAAYLYLTLYQL